MRDDSDLWTYIHKLKEETQQRHKGRSLSDVIIDIYEQLPFFVCNNMLIQEDFMKDIRRYSYCNNSGQKPYSGAYGDTPSLWVDKFFLIKNVIDKYKHRKEKEEMRKQKSKSKARV